MTDDAPLRALLRSLVDYAGLYPPAALSMREAVDAYARHRRSADAWALGKFILPAARLTEYEAARAESPADDRQSDAWPLSVLLGEDAAADLAAINAFVARQTGRSAVGNVEAFEVKATGAGRAESVSHLVRKNFATPPPVYYEIPVGENANALLGAVKRVGGRAKVRAGGVTAEMFPRPDELIDFVDACAARAVPFKATAGLHHPLRGRHRLTYEADGASATMHGFLNLFLAAVFRWNGKLGNNALVDLLEDGSRSAFRFDEYGIRWRDESLGVGEVARARAAFADSFGSCSFDEPMEDLRNLRLL